MKFGVHIARMLHLRHVPRCLRYASQRHFHMQRPQCPAVCKMYNVSVAQGALTSILQTCTNSQKITHLQHCLTMQRFSSKSISERHADITSVNQLDKALQLLMGELDVEEAVELVQIKEKLHLLPSASVTIDLMQQLANLGEYSLLLELRDILLDREAVSETRFNTLLQEAYQQSGRVEEAVDMIRKMYFIKRHFSKVSTFFTQVTNMIIREYPESVWLVEEFVDNCMKLENPGPDYEPLGHLWKCFVMSQEVDKANELLENEDKSEHLQPQLNQMVTAICEASEEEKAGIDEEVVLKQVIAISYVLTPEVKQLVYTRLLVETSE